MRIFVVGAYCVCMYVCMYTFIPTGFDRQEKIDGLRLRRKHFGFNAA